MILATQFNEFEKGTCALSLFLVQFTDVNLGALFHTYTDSLLGTGVFNADGRLLPVTLHHAV